MKELGKFLGMAGVFTLLASATVFCQVASIKLGFEISALQESSLQLEDEYYKLLLEVNRLHAPQALFEKSERFKIEISQPPSDRFIQCKTSPDAVTTAVQ